MNKNQKGFSAVEVLLVVVIVGIIGFVGWFVWSNKAKSSQASEQSQQTTQPNMPAAKQEAKLSYTPPAGWVTYDVASSGVSFYYPPNWKADSFKVTSYSITDNILSGYGTPDSWKYDESASKWVNYLNYGDSAQKTTEGVETSKVEISATKVPVMYFKSGHAAVASYDILLVKDKKAFRIRLPEINTFNDNWESQYVEQTAAVENIAKSVIFL